MSEKEKQKISKTISYLLRHNPENLEISKKGYVDLDKLLKKLKKRWNNLTKKDIKEIALEDEKGRYEIKDNKIRALYGHSINISLELETKIDMERLFHGTTKEVFKEIMEEGLKPMSRQFVHLSPSKEEAKDVAMRRTKKPVILEIQAKKATEDGIKIMKASEKVYISEEIPPKHIKKI